MAGKIKRRYRDVLLYQGDYEQRLLDLYEAASLAERKERVSGGRRFAGGSEALRLAQEHDDLREEAQETAVRVRVWAVDHVVWRDLAADHPPREDRPDELRVGVNTDTFPDQLMLAAVVDPDETTGLSLDDRLARGQEALDELGALTHIQFVKIRSGAWEVNAGDDAIPKSSLVSLLMARRGDSSQPQSDSGSAPAD